jgi:KaiC/GvpD/RAD55 family RecA-like ATPase
MELLSRKKSGSSSTQRYVEVEEIRDGVLVLKTGALRAVLLVSSINFDLKSSEEQDAIISQYQNFLNSLDFPVQILVQSRRFNIDPYIELLKARESQQMNELLRFQMREYQGFIKNLTEISNIMSKFFYVVVPFSPVENSQGGFFQKIGDIHGH